MNKSSSQMKFLECKYSDVKLKVRKSYDVLNRPIIVRRHLQTKNHVPAVLEAKPIICATDIRRNNTEISRISVGYSDYGFCFAPDYSIGRGIFPAPTQRDVCTVCFIVQKIKIHIAFCVNVFLTFPKK